MARYEPLPIYKKAMELNVYLHEKIRNFSCYNKYTIGSELRKIAQDILLLIIRANSATEKEKILMELMEQCEMLKSLLIFAKEAKAFQSFKSFQHAAGFAVLNSDKGINS